jgi:hypothetical protein
MCSFKFFNQNVCTVNVHEMYYKFNHGPSPLGDQQSGLPPTEDKTVKEAVIASPMVRSAIDDLPYTM